VRTKSLDEFLATPAPDVDYIIKPQLLAAGGTMAVYGRAGTLKSWLCMDMAFSIASGSKWLGVFDTVPSSVLMVQSEQIEAQYQKRVAKFYKHYSGAAIERINSNLAFDNDLEIKLDSFTGLNAITEDIKERKPQVVILDCLYQLVSGSVSSEVDLKRFKDNIDHMRQSWLTAFIIIHHTRKTYGDDDHGIEEMMSSSIFGNWLDTTIKISSNPPNTNQPTQIEMEFQKVRGAEDEMPPIKFGFNRSTVQFALR